MGRKDASAARTPVDQYRKQIVSNYSSQGLRMPDRTPWKHVDTVLGAGSCLLCQGKQDYKKTRPMLKATRLKAEAKKTALGIKEVSLVLAAILVFLLACYAFFYLKLSEEVDQDLAQDGN